MNKKLNYWRIILIHWMLQTILPAEPYDEAAMADLYNRNKDRECKVWKIACRCRLDLWCPNFFKMNSSTLMQMIRGDPFRWDGTSPFCSGKCSGWDITNHYHHLKSVETIQNDIFRYLFHKTTQKNVKVVLMFHLWRDELEVREHTAGDGKQCWTGAVFFEIGQLLHFSLFCLLSCLYMWWHFFSFFRSKFPLTHFFF